MPYCMKFVFTKMTPSITYSIFPNVGKEKIIEELKKFGINDLEKGKQGEGKYKFYLGQGLVIIIRENKKKKK